jgi:tRNA/rRNA methyltransferase
MHIVFILVNSKNEGNIGASARALNTMGFESLRLVRPRAKQWRNEVSLAHGSRDILDRAEIFDTTAEAIADLDFIVGSTARRRNYQYDYISSRGLAGFLASKGDRIDKVGILFGTEPEGLSNEDLALCDVASSIPMERPQPSINLSQAVMIYAYELAQNGQLQPEIGLTPLAKNASEASYRNLKVGVASILEEIGVRGDSVLSKKTLEKLALLSGENLDLAHYIHAKLSARIRETQQIGKS